MKPIVRASLLAIALAAFIPSASAVGIPVGNFSFEDPAPPADPGYSLETSILDWSFTTEGTDNGGVQTFASSPDITSLGAADGANYAWMNVGAGDTDTITYTGTGTPTESGTGTDTAIALPTIVAGDSYTLTVAMDNRSGVSYGDLTLSLIAGGGDFFTTTVAESSLPTDTFAMESVTLSSAQTASLGGETLGIQLGATAPSAAGYQADFDNVTLTETPEPSVWALMGLGGLILLAGLNRIKRRA